jgi:hypothetical protein
MRNGGLSGSIRSSQLPESLILQTNLLFSTTPSLPLLTSISVFTTRLAMRLLDWQMVKWSLAAIQWRLMPQHWMKEHISAFSEQGSTPEHLYFE